MSPEPNRSVPFASLPGCLREDFLYRIMLQVIGVAPTSSAPSSAALATSLAPIPIPGFRQFHRAPRGLQARAAISRFRASGAFVGRVLDVWLEANRPLAALVEEFLDAQGIPRERIRAEEEHFRDRWSLDEVLRLADLFRAEHPTDRDDAALLLCCLTSRAPVADDPITGDAAAADRPAAMGEDGATPDDASALPLGLGAGDSAEARVERGKSREAED